MALTQRLELRQSQALVMTPQLMQAIKLLQLSNLDLTAYVEGELEQNPLLERIGDGEEGVRTVAPDAGSHSDAPRPAWRENGHAAPDRVREAVSAVGDDVPATDADAASSRSNAEWPAGHEEWGRGNARDSGRGRDAPGWTVRSEMGTARSTWIGRCRP